MSLSSKRSKLGLVFDAGILCPAATTSVFADGLLLNMLGNQRGGGLGGIRTVKVYFVVFDSISPRGSK